MYKKERTDIVTFKNRQVARRMNRSRDVEIAPGVAY
jgi:hypothetical protein